MNAPTPRFTFSKHERLCSRKAIESLFQSGKAINEPPLRFLWKETAHLENVSLKIIISVPKKNFKKAVDRNKIKRHIREAYRLNRHKFLEEIVKSGRKFSAIIIYTGKKPLTWREMEAKISVTLQRFVSEICKKQLQNS
ncbi:MAG: ribonuclease P protein component [Bacteroidia bacterium]